MKLASLAFLLSVPALAVACAQPTDGEPAAENAAPLTTSAAVDLPSSTSPYQVTCRSTDAHNDVRVYITQTDVKRFRALVRMTKPSALARVYDVVPSWSGSGWNFDVPGQSGESLAPFHVLAFPNGEGNIQVFEGARPIVDLDTIACTIDL